MIKIYGSPDVSDSFDTTDANSIISGHNKRAFLPDIRKFYLRNDDPTKWVSNIQLRATSIGADVTSGANGFGFKFFWGDIEPTNRVWQKLGYNQEIAVNNIGTDSIIDTSFYPFWMRVEASPISDVGMYEAKILVDYIEHLV